MIVDIFRTPWAYKWFMETCPIKKLLVHKTDWENREAVIEWFYENNLYAKYSEEHGAIFVHLPDEQVTWLTLKYA